MTTRNCEHCRGLGFVCEDGTPANALGKPSPGRTDFVGWTRGSLEVFARHAADENLVLRENLRALQDAWRQQVGAALPRDAQRLDWIARQGDEFSSGILQDCPGDGDYYVHGMDAYGTGKTFRDAIDAAMQSVTVYERTPGVPHLDEPQQEGRKP